MYLIGCQGITENALEGLGVTGFLGGNGVEDEEMNVQKKEPSDYPEGSL